MDFLIQHLQHDVSYFVKTPPPSLEDVLYRQSLTTGKMYPQMKLKIHKNETLTDDIFLESGADQ